METPIFKRAWALDLHGIITAAPEFLSAVTRSLEKDGWEIHILTGSHLKENNIEQQLKDYKIAYTHLFSIADYHRENKTDGMWYDEKGDPWVSDEDWDRTKAMYCKKHGIMMCTDDTARYASHFETPFSYMSIQTSKDAPNKYLNSIINMFNVKRQKDAADKANRIERAKNIYDRFECWFNRHLGPFFSPPSKLGKGKKNAQALTKK
jgi:hypothetical protein